ncbi:MAG: pyridoxal-phosphate dependent enzyme [Planctomycetes bacterium]|nr:pyridoxal-phosphate dependent enzyme [Planctomycetota bacterium]
MTGFALTRHLPNVEVPHVSLGEYPTPIEHLPALGDVWLKREDLSSPIYGGNKIRTLETLFADAQARGIKRINTLGAYGSNQAVACILHGRRLGLDTGAILFPQRATPTAAENMRVIMSECDRVTALRSIVTFPVHWLRLRGSRDTYLVPPGGANPLGALGHSANALEIAEQIHAGAMPTPKHLVVAIGSTCTTAGLLVGLPLAKQLGVWPGELPKLHAVRVTPWPVTARSQVMKLARATAKYLERIGGPKITPDPKMLVLNTKHFGWGYARVTPGGLAAASHFEELTAPPLDTTYAAKSGAALLELARETEGPILFWCTKSSAPLPEVNQQKLACAPGYIRRWLKRADNHSAFALSTS